MFFILLKKTLQVLVLVVEKQILKEVLFYKNDFKTCLHYRAL